MFYEHEYKNLLIFNKKWKRLMLEYMVIRIRAGLIHGEVS